jgi:hypothetical protein
VQGYREAIQWQTARPPAPVDGNDTRSDTAGRLKAMAYIDFADLAGMWATRGPIWVRNYGRRNRANPGEIFNAEGWPSGRCRWS